MLAALVGLLALGKMDPNWAETAKQVIIRRDAYGVPHISGPTDASVAFGLMYAQAEDQYSQLEHDTIYAIGRAAEIDREHGYGNDLRVRMFEVPRHAQEALQEASPAFQRLAQGYADGLNYFLATHPNVRPALLTRFEPWYFLANVDLPGQVDGVSIGRTPAGPIDPGSNAWAIAPSRTESGYAVLFSNPHVGLFGRGQRYECHVTSGEGWDFSGFAILGNPIPHAGHNRHLGWSHTNTGADSADAYREHVENGRYRVGSEWLPIREWKESIGGHEVTLRATRRGPLVGEFSVRFPVEKAVRVWEQKLAMGKSRTLAEFRRALAIGGLVGSNTTYADADGHIAFWYANCVPRRDPSFDWTKPVDGTDPRTEWQGYLTPDELPHVIDPKSGFVQNCNSDPWNTSTSDNPVPERIPPYVVHDHDTARSANSRRILASKPKFGWDELTRLATDGYVYTAAERLPGMIEAAGREADLKEPVEVLKGWDYRISTHSVAATLYFESELDLLSQGIGNRRLLGGTSEQLVQAMKRTVHRLESEFGTWQVGWGRVNRLRRVPEGPSLPVVGAPSVFGQVFAFGYPFHPGGVHYGTEGNTYVALAEFGPQVRTVSVCGFGQSADPASPHFFDQAELYATGRFKPAWFSESEVEANTRRRYRPVSHRSREWALRRWA